MKRNTIILLAAFFVITTIIQLFVPIFRNFENDDGYVTFVIARNIARGEGFSYNAGDFTSGSTFLWPVVLSAVYMIVGDSLPIAAKVLSTALTWCAIFITYLIMHKLSKDEKVSLIVAFLVAINPWINMWAAAAADTILFTVVTLLSIYLYLSNKEKAAILFSSLSYLARSEGGFLFVIILVHIFLKDMNAGKKLKTTILKTGAYVLAFLLVVSPWLLLIYANEGNIFPKAFLTKRVMYEYFTTAVGPIKFSHIFIMDMVMILPILSGAFIMALLWRLNRKSLLENKSVVFLWPVISVFSQVFISYSATAHRYIMPLIPVILISVFVFLSELKKLKIDIVKLFAIILVVMLPIQYAILGAKLSTIDKDAYSHFEISQWIVDNIPPDANVAIGELGIIKWDSERYYYDVAGIVDDPKVVTGGFDGFVSYLVENNIDYVVNPVKYSSENFGDDRVRLNFAVLTLSEVIDFSGVEWGVYTTENLVAQP